MQVVGARRVKALHTERVNEYGLRTNLAPRNLPTLPTKMQNDINQNTGVIERKPQPQDWIAGGETGITFEERMPAANWSKYLPSCEKQKGLFDTMACVSFSALNCVEAQINFLMSAGLIDKAQLKTLKSLGFIGKDGLFNCSDRFTAKMSGTTKNGNYLTAVWDSIRNHGLLPEKDWAFDLSKFDWEYYYTEIPQELKDKAKKILDIMEFSYEYVFPGSLNCQRSIKEHLKQAPLQIAAPVCPDWSSNNVVPTCGLTRAQHATMIYGFEDKKLFNDFDHYDPFEKQLDWNYPIPYVIKGVATLKKPIEAPKTFKHEFQQVLNYGMRGAEVVALQDALKADGVFPLTVNSTGYFGEITRAAVMAFQRKHEVAPEDEIVVANGRVGRKTLKALNEIFA